MRFQPLKNRVFARVPPKEAGLDVFPFLPLFREQSVKFPWGITLCSRQLLEKNGPVSCEQ